MYIAWSKCIYLVLLYIVLWSIFYNFRSLYSLCISSRLQWCSCIHRTPKPHYVLASCMLVDLNIWCVYVESLVTKHMYFVAYLVVGFHSHLHLSSFNINTIIHMKGECKSDPSLCKRGGRYWFCKMNVLNKKLLFFWLLLDYTCTCYGILNLIKKIHVPQSISMRATPPCVIRAALFLPCVLRTAMFWPSVLRIV